MLTQQLGKSEGAANPERRRFLACLATLGLGAAFGGLETMRLLAQEPMAEQPKTKKLSDREAIKCLFLHAPMSHSRASEFLAQATGNNITKYSFPQYGELCLPLVQEFYSFNPIFCRLPNQLTSEHEGTRLISGQVMGNQTYRTHCFGNDGRVKALTEYLLTRENATSEAEAIRTTAVWVIGNIRLDEAHSNAQFLTINGQKSNDKLGIGGTNSFDNSADIILKGGLSGDYSNLIADMLNSVGIASRAISIASIGTYCTEGRTAIAISSFSMVQVFMKSGLAYIDVEPRGIDGKTSATICITDNPIAWLEMKNQAHEAFEQCSISIAGAIPKESVPKALSEAIRKHGSDYASQSDFRRAYGSYWKADDDLHEEPERHIIYIYLKPGMRKIHEDNRPHESIA